jgi:hypothetical protein
MGWEMCGRALKTLAECLQKDAQGDPDAWPDWQERKQHLPDAAPDWYLARGNIDAVDV